MPTPTPAQQTPTPSRNQIHETMQVAHRLVELCRTGQNRKAIEELYADTVEFHEAMEGGPKANGPLHKDEILKGSDWFFENNEIHASAVEGPYPNADRFICFMSIDLTPKAGPMAGQRMQMTEGCLYTVKNGKITRSEFFYAPPPGC